MRIIFGIAIMFNMNMVQGSSAGDVSLEAIAVMAQAQSGESNMLPDVTVYGCSASYYQEETYYGVTITTKCCTYWTSTSPCSSEC